eukprot:g354.t1 g354   contig1:859468-860853(+)
MSRSGSDPFNYQEYLDEEEELDALHQAKRRKEAIIYASAIATVAAASIPFGALASAHQGRVPGAVTVKRQRLAVEDYCQMLSDKHFRRRYRMWKESFWNLLHIVGDNLPSTGENRKNGCVPNGPISHAAHLSMALRIAAGADPLDIATNHGVNDNQPMVSFWLVMDAIHKSPQLDMQFPTLHEEQKKVAKEFESKSSIGISCCVGAIDGILIWIHKPSDSDCDMLGFGQTKFFCGRKKKFGLNMQAVCDAKRRFMWVDIRYPGTTSDFFAFDQSSLKDKLEQPGFLHSGLCLFGDAAYANSSYMCSPFRSATGTQDDFNFFQSQLRITIECAFGMLVHRFGILRKAFPVNVTVSKTNVAVLGLCKLHNFCIQSSNCEDDIVASDFRDVSNIIMEGGMVLPLIDRDDGSDNRWRYEEEDRLDNLLDGGQHMDDHDRTDRRRCRYQEVPRQAIHEYIVLNEFR